MTSGTKVTLPSALNIFTWVPGSKKIWSGTDGKYETVGGIRREKWNNYSSDIVFNYAGTNFPGGSTNPGSYWGVDISTSNPPSFFTSNDQLILLSKLADKIRGHSFNLAVNAAQGKQTVNMMIEALHTFRRTYRSLRAGDIGQACSLLGVRPRARLKGQTPESRWLELQYGWLPFLSDCYESAKAYHALTDGPRKVCGKVSRQKKTTWNSSVSPPNYTVNAAADYRRSIKFEIYEALSAPRSLGLLDPLSVAWEIIPYSFVVDWFIPFGTYLDNLSVLSNVTGRFLTIDFRRDEHHCNPVPSGFQRGLSGTSVQIRYKRTFSTNISVPFPGINSLPAAMSPRRIWNAIALTRQAFFR